MEGAHKRMIYAYFRNKDRLYEAIIERRIAEWVAVPLTPDDLASYAALRATSRAPLGSKRLARHRKVLLEAFRHISEKR